MASSDSLRIGIIAEEDNDVDVLRELTCKILQEKRFSFKKFVGHGCGKLRQKCRAWAFSLLKQGCSFLVVVHDLDERKEHELRAELEGKIGKIQFTLTVILIPVREIEAWLLSDPKALKRVFRMSRIPKITTRPETIPNPKRFLSNLVSSHSRKQYINTIHNRQIANQLILESLNRCPSFSRYPRFLSQAKSSLVESSA